MAGKPGKAQRSPTVVVIGAGMTGLLAAIKLKEAGYKNTWIFEKAETLGGTWRENNYPGVACDIPSHMYTYSFAPNAEWSNVFAKGAEIQSYLLKVACDYGVFKEIHFNESVTHCILKANQWHVTTSKNTEVCADFVINCTGILHHPAWPDIPGIKDFKGHLFHTAQWDKNLDLKNKRIGVIGTGSTAAQAIPELAKVAGHLTVFQRTPQWIFHLPDHVFSEREKSVFRTNPLALKALRAVETWNISHLLTKAVIGHPFQKSLLNLACKANLRLSVKDPQLRKKLTPNYAVGCKRIVVNSTFYTAIQKPNVTLETSGITKFTAQGILTDGGKEHTLDCVVLSTGFNAKNYMRPMHLVGRNGLHINDAWKNKVRTYRSVCLPDFPNNFLMLGPHSPIGNFSVIAISEVQLAYVLKLIANWCDGDYDLIEPKPEAVTWFESYVKQGLKKTAWKGGCQSWYLDADGDPILWPYTWEAWVEQMNRVDLAHFHCEVGEVTPETESMACATGKADSPTPPHMGRIVRIN